MCKKIIVPFIWKQLKTQQRTNQETKGNFNASPYRKKEKKIPTNQKKERTLTYIRTRNVLVKLRMRISRTREGR